MQLEKLSNQMYKSGSTTDGGNGEVIVSSLPNLEHSSDIQYNKDDNTFEFASSTWNSSWQQYINQGSYMGIFVNPSKALHQDTFYDMKVSPSDDIDFITRRGRKVYKVVNGLADATWLQTGNRIGGSDYLGQELWGTTFDKDGNFYGITARYISHTGGDGYYQHGNYVYNPKFTVNSYKIYKVDPQGNQTLYATLSDMIDTHFNNNNNGMPTSQYYPTSMTFDNNNNLYISIGPVILRLDSNGNESIFYGVHADEGDSWDYDYDLDIQRIAYNPVTNDIIWTIMNTYMVTGQERPVFGVKKNVDHLGTNYLVQVASESSWQYLRPILKLGNENKYVDTIYINRLQSI